MFGQYWENVLRVWNYIWGNLSLVMGFLIQIGAKVLGVLVLLAGQLLIVGGGVIAFLFVLFGYVVYGALLERWLRWAFKNWKKVLPILTLVAWVPVAAAGVSLIGALPLTFQLVDVPTAAGIGLVALIISVVVNLFFDPLDWPMKFRNWRAAYYKPTIADLHLWATAQRGTVGTDDDLGLFDPNAAYKMRLLGKPGESSGLTNVYLVEENKAGFVNMEYMERVRAKNPKAIAASVVVAPELEAA